MLLAAGLRRHAFGRELDDRRALADLAFQAVHRLVAYNDRRVRSGTLAGVGVFGAGDADGELERLDQHGGVGCSGNAGQSRRRDDQRPSRTTWISHTASPSRREIRGLDR